MTPIASVLIPSRGRPERLAVAIASIRNTSMLDYDDVEIIVRVDSDDAETIKALDVLVPEFEIVPIIGDKLNGWYSVNQFYTEMLDKAKGIWAWMFNDDVTIEGNEWNLKLKRVPPYGFVVQPEFHQLNHSVYSKDAEGPFPIVPVAAFRKYGLIPIPHPPDKEVNRILLEHGWETGFLEGVTINHQRKIDETLPKERY